MQNIDNIQFEHVSVILCAMICSCCHNIPLNKISNIFAGLWKMLFCKKWYVCKISYPSNSICKHSVNSAHQSKSHPSTVSTQRVRKSYIYWFIAQRVNVKRIMIRVKRQDTNKKIIQNDLAKFNIGLIEFERKDIIWIGCCSCRISVWVAVCKIVWCFIKVCWKFCVQKESKHLMWEIQFR